MDVVELPDSSDNDVTYVIGSKWYVRLWNWMKRVFRLCLCHNMFQSG